MSETFIVHRPEPEGFRGRARRSRAAGSSSAALPSAPSRSSISPTSAPWQYAQQRLKRLGVDRALARAGVRHGDVVRIGGFVFEYEAD